MAFFADRVRETTTTTGTGTITLDGAAFNFDTFTAAAAADGGDGETRYVIEDASGGWEVGEGTVLSGPPRLTRTRVLASSNGGALVSFGDGTKDVRLTAPASLLSAVREWRFDWGDATPKALYVVPAGKVIQRVCLAIRTAFDGTNPTLSVGDAGDPDRLLAASENDPSAVGYYEVRPGHVYASATAIVLTITPGAGASAGSGILTIEIER